MGHPYKTSPEAEKKIAEWIKRYAELVSSKQAEDPEIQSQLDMFSVQSNSDDLIYALDGLDSLETVVLYTNLDARLEINGIMTNKSFSSCIIAKGTIGKEQHGKLVSFMDGIRFNNDLKISDDLSFKKGDVLDSEAIKQILKAKGINFIEMISSLPKTTESESCLPIPKTWFGRDTQIIEESVGSITENKTTTYYPNVTARIELKFIELNGRTIIIDERSFEGLLELEDKILLPVSTSKQVKKVFIF